MIVLTTSGLLTALAGAAFYLFARRHTADPRRSLMATLTVFLATPILGWSVNFFGHAAAGSTLFLGFYALSGIAAGARHNTRKVILGGALLGLAMVIEYTVAPAAALIGCYGIWRLAGLGAGPAAAHPAEIDRLRRAGGPIIGPEIGLNHLWFAVAQGPDRTADLVKGQTVTHAAVFLHVHRLETDAVGIGRVTVLAGE